jgi:hypothetical protein
LVAVVLFCGIAVAQGQNGKDEEAAKEIFALLNQARAHQGLAPLAWDSRLAAAARRHAELMAEGGEVAHVLPGEQDVQHRLAATGMHFDRSGENVALNVTPEAVHQAFTRSREHRENILDPRYNAVGIAAVRWSEGLYVVEDFAHHLPELSERQFKAEVVQQIARLNKRRRGPPWKQVAEPRLDALACDMARTDKLDTQRALNSTGGLSAAVYTAMTPDELPDSVMEMRDGSEVRAYSVGVCFARTKKYPAGAYWVAVVFFGPSKRH